MSAARQREARRVFGAYVITDARRQITLSMGELVCPPSLLSIVAAHMCRADGASVGWRRAYAVYAALSLVLVAAAYAAAWLFANPGRLSLALALGIVAMGVL
jgi:hypothetical protein